MVRAFVIGAALALDMTAAASAAVTPALIGVSNGLVIKVDEKCGRDMWLGPGGKCYPMYNGRACPIGFHLGPDRRKCWPNESR